MSETTTIRNSSLNEALLLLSRAERILLGALTEEKPRTLASRTTPQSGPSIHPPENDTTEMRHKLLLAKYAIHRIKKTEGVEIKSVAHAGFYRFEKKITYDEYKAIVDEAEVLGLPATTPKRSERQELDPAQIVKDYNISSPKHAGYLRANKILSYEEFMAVREAGDTAWVTT